MVKRPFERLEKGIARVRAVGDSFLEFNTWGTSWGVLRVSGGRVGHFVLADMDCTDYVRQLGSIFSSMNILPPPGMSRIASDLHRVVDRVGVVRDGQGRGGDIWPDEGDSGFDVCAGDPRTYYVCRTVSEDEWEEFLQEVARGCFLGWKFGGTGLGVGDVLYSKGTPGDRVEWVDSEYLYCFDNLVRSKFGCRKRRVYCTIPCGRAEVYIRFKKR